MCSVIFLPLKRLIHVEFSPRDETINSDVYCEPLQRPQHNIQTEQGTWDVVVKVCLIHSWQRAASCISTNTAKNWTPKLGNFSTSSLHAWLGSKWLSLASKTEGFCGWKTFFQWWRVLTSSVNLAENFLWQKITTLELKNWSHVTISALRTMYKSKVHSYYKM